MLKQEAVGLLLADRELRSPRQRELAPLEDWLYDRLVATGAAEENRFNQLTKPLRAAVLEAQAGLELARTARLTIRSSETYNATRTLDSAKAALQKAEAGAPEADERVAVVVPRYLTYRRGLIRRPFAGWKRMAEVHRAFRQKFGRRIKLVRCNRLLLSFTRWKDSCAAAAEAAATPAQKARLAKLRQQQQWVEWEAADARHKKKAAGNRVRGGAIANRAMRERHTAEAMKWKTAAVEREQQKKAEADAHMLKQEAVFKERLDNLAAIEAAEAKSQHTRQLNQIHVQSEVRARADRQDNWLNTSGLDTFAWLRSMKAEQELDMERRPATALATITGMSGLSGLSPVLARPRTRGS